MKALVTGVGGFVGPHLVRHLLDRGFEVFGVDRNDSEVEGCTVYKCDITDYSAVSSIVSKTRPDLIFHLAGQSSVELSWKEPELTRRINVFGTKNLLDAVVSANLSPKILIVSSAEVYGIPKSFPITENHELAPVSPYGKSKVEQERLSLGFKDLHIVVCRSFPHIGPGQPSNFVASNFAKQVVMIETGKSSAVKVGNIESRRDFTDVRDVVRAYLLALEKCPPHSVYNVCSGKDHTIKSMLDIMLSLSKARNIKVETEPSRMRKSDIPVLVGNPGKFISATGWAPKIKLEKTLADLLEYWRLK
jgi:GDP-4-dehydro-6-deoxy-D-mannose reductase